MELAELMEYTIWADNTYLDYCNSISQDEFEKEFLSTRRSIKHLLFHIYEVYWYWGQFLTERNDKRPVIEEMNRTSLIQGIRQQHNFYRKYITSHDLQNLHTEHWGDDKPVSRTAEDYIFNFITHNAYHRGQLALLLRECGFDKIEETDYNPYKYMKHQQDD